MAGLDLFMVGDAQQSIYGFRYADVDLFEERGRRLDRIGGRASLQTNFRSRPEILMALNGAFDIALGDSFRPLLPGREDEAYTEPVVELLIVDKRGSPSASTRTSSRRRSPGGWPRHARSAIRIRDLIDAAQRAPATSSCCCGRRPTCTSTSRRWSRRGAHLRDRGPRLLGPSAGDRAGCIPASAGESARYEALYTVFLSPLCGLSLDGLVLGDAAAPHELSDIDRTNLERFDSWVQDRTPCGYLGRARAAT